VPASPRADGSDAPVVFPTARDATADRPRGLTTGGELVHTVRCPGYRLEAR
jgi:DNA-binding response OmpR family regulator